MSDTHKDNMDAMLDVSEAFHESTFKMYALTELIPMVLSEDYGGPQDNDLRGGVAYLLADVRKDMARMSDAYWQLRNDKHTSAGGADTAQLHAV